MQTEFNNDSFENDFNPTFDFASNFDEQDENGLNDYNFFDNEGSIINISDIFENNNQKQVNDDNKDTNPLVDEFDYDYNNYINTDINSDQSIDLFDDDIDEEIKKQQKFDLFGGIDSTNDTFDIDLSNNSSSNIFNELNEQDGEIDSSYLFDNNANLDNQTLNINNDMNEENGDESNFDSSVDSLEKLSVLNDDINFNSINSEDDSEVEYTDSIKDDLFLDFDKRIESLDSSTDYEEVPENSKTDISDLFVKVNNNVQEASNFFLKNSDMKRLLDNRFEELKKLQSDVELSRKQGYEDIDNYKEETLQKINERKDEIDEKIASLNDYQVKLDKDKEEFETYKKEEILKIEKMRDDEKLEFEKRKNELARIEDKLRRMKDSIEEERRQLNLDQIQYETDKKELAANMIKFNDIVSKFTNGIDQIN